MMFDLVLVKTLYRARSGTVQLGLEINHLCPLLRDHELENPNEAAEILPG